MNARVSKLPHWPPRLPNMRGGERWQAAPKIALFLLTTVVLTAILYFQLDSDRVGLDAHLREYRAGAPTPRAVVAPHRMTWEDVRATARARDDAANHIPNVLVFDPTAADTAQGRLTDILASLEGKTSQNPVITRALSPALREQAHALDAATWGQLREDAQRILPQIMALRIEEDAPTQALEIQLSAYAAPSLEPAAQPVLLAVLRAAVQPTWVIDHVKTQSLRSEARAKIPMQYRLFQRGETIIPPGERLSDAELDQLLRQGLLWPAPLARLLPLAILVAVAVLAFGLFLRLFASAVYTNPRKMILLSGLLIAGLWATATLGIGKNEYLVGLIVIPAGCMAIAGLLGLPTGLFASILLSILGGLASEHQFAIVLLTIGSAIAGILVVRAIWPASRTVPALGVLVLVNLALLAGVASVVEHDGIVSLWKELGHLAIEALAGGLGATFIAVGAIYILARPFGITTHYRLMELSNPNEPVLRKMMLEAPGSYHSSVMVANIAESAAYAIGANALLTRVSALYHDIGKLKRPGFFVENQAPLGIENMHQRLSPKLSYLILTSHVKEGVDLAREIKLPEEIITIIREHHGTTLAAFFYHRAVSAAGGEAVAEHEYRYPGPKPSSRESAIVMLSDSVQASVKSLKEPTPGRIEDMVQDIITNRLNDGQLDDCDITLRDLRRLKEVFVRTLTGLYTYTRIEYPDAKGNGARIYAHLNSEPASPTGESTAAAPRG